MQVSDGIDAEAKNSAGKSKAPRRLVIEAQKGNVDAINRVVELYYEDLLYFAMKEVGFHDGADVVQQAVVRLVNKLGDLRDPSKIKSWMMSAVYRECLNFRQRKKRQSEQVRVIELNEETVQTIDSKTQVYDDVPSADQDEGLLFEALDSLPQNYASAIRLRYKDDLSNQEIAEVLGVDEKKVRNDMHRGLKLLGKRIEKHGGQRALFALGPAGAIPYLTEALQHEQALFLSPDIVAEGLAVLKQNLIAQLGDAAATATTTTTAATAATTTATTSTIAKIGIGSALTLALVAGGAAFVLTNATPDDPAPLVQEAPAPTQTTEQAPPAPAEPAPINTIADMIGAEPAAQLARYEAEGVDEATWRAFITQIGAEDEGTAYEPDYIYDLHRLIKQDKQLVLASRQSVNGGLLQVIAEFGPAGDLPRIVKVIQMFP